MIGRRYLPKTFFMRGLLILLLPILLVEVVSAYVFYERHWQTVTRHMTASLAGEIAFLAYQEGNLSRPEREELEWTFGWTTAITSHFTPHAKLPTAEVERRQDFPELASVLRRRIAFPFTVQRINSGETLQVSIQLPDGVLALTTTAKRLESTTTTIFFLWVLGATVVCVGIAIVFLRNQVRPIRQLAEAAERFGKGSAVLKPHGALEVRRAARAFLIMRERILRQLRSRTEMLAGISHDLRTPLTRMKLQLALLGDTPETRELAEDATQMEHMISEYLDFARGNAGEEAEAVSLAALLAAVTEGYKRTGQEVPYALEQDVMIRVRPQAFRRMLTNLIDNALRYGTRCSISTRVSVSKLELMIDDAGPGISPDKRDTVFRPFIRLDNSRNPKSGGVGLGLTIARDIARSHGGNITLADAPLGGLRALVRLPL